MKIASALGTLEFLLIFLPAICWCWDFRLGFRTALILAIGHGIGESFKIVFHTPRPYWISHDIKALTSYPSFSFPSSHALDATCAWGMLASSSKKLLAWAAACVLVLIIGLSRVYLGVHFPWDVIAGWITGAVILVAFLKAEPTFSKWFWRHSLQTQIFISFFSSLAILILYALSRASLGGWQAPEIWYQDALASSGSAIAPFNPAEALTTAGLIFGAAAGYSLLLCRRKFRADGPMIRKIERYALGMIGLILIWYGLGSIGSAYFGPESTIAYATIYVRSALAGSWFTLGAPELFMRVGLAETIQTDSRN
jgi:hypothetical protein